MTDRPHSRRIYYGWFVLAAGFAILATAITIRSSFGIFFKPILTDIGLSRSALSLPVALSLILYGAIQPVSGFLVYRYGVRAVTVAGSLVSGIAVLGMSQIDSLFGIYFFFGILLAIGGVGNGPAPVVSLVTSWFRKRRGMALSIVFVGISAGQLVGFPLIVRLLEAVGWRVSFVWLGLVLILGLAPLCFWIIRNSPKDVDFPPEEAAGPVGEEEPPVLSFRLVLTQVVRTPSFLILSSAFFSAGYAVSAMYVHWVPYATDVGFAATTATTAFAVGVGMSIPATLFIGPLSDRIGRKLPLCAAYLFRGTGISLFPLLQNDFALWAGPILIGMGWLAPGPLTSALAGDQFGPRNVAVVIGFIMVIYQIGQASGAWVSGYLHDLTGSYKIAFFLAGYLCLQATVISAFIQEKRRRPFSAGATAA